MDFAKRLASSPIISQSDETATKAIRGDLSVASLKAIPYPPADRLNATECP